MKVEIKSAIIGASISSGISLLIFFLGNFSTQATLETKTVETLSEYFSVIDKDMSYKDALQSLYAGYVSLNDSNNQLKGEKEQLNVDKNALTNEINQLEEKITEMQKQIDDSEKIESIINIAKSHADSENYEKAILTLNSIKAPIPEIEQLIDEYSRKYEIQIIIQASNLENYEKYDEAIDKIKGALKVLPNSVDLTSKIDEINSRKPKFFLDTCTFYETSRYTQYANGEWFLMSGKERTNGFTIYDRNGVGYAISNIEGAFNEISFDVGHVDNTSMVDAKLMIYRDGILYKTYEIKADALASNIKIPITNVNQIKIVVENYDATLGFADVMIK